MDKSGQAKSKGRRGSRKRSTLDLGSGDGNQQVLCTAESAGQLEADKFKVGARVVAEEADISKLGEGLGDIQLLQEGGAYNLENEVNLGAHFVDRFEHFLAIVLCSASCLDLCVMVGFVQET